MISANVLSGPFYEPFAEASFQSIQPLVDEILVIDTAPGNNPNEEVNKKYATKILQMDNGGTKDFSFSAARELARKKSKYRWILKWDQDEVLHENDVIKIAETVLNTKNHCIELAFYHFMVYPWLYQFIDTKRFLFLKDKAEWDSNVHEGVYIDSNKFEKLHDVKVFHYGYLRGQEEVFKRWLLYAQIVDKESVYNGVDPSSILEDRIPVCQNFTGEHPLVAQDVLKQMFYDVTPFRVKEIPKYSMTDNYAGLVLLTYNDAENLPGCLGSFLDTVDYPVIVTAIDLGSTDDSLKMLKNFQEICYSNSFIKDFEVISRGSLEHLTKSLNFGFKHLMSRQECNMIGWIHPDMVFEKGWLSNMAAVLMYETSVGKSCAFNTQLPLPVSYESFEGDEQAYLIKRGVLFDIGLFNEAYIGIGGYEDWDMNNRIRQEGLRVVITPKSRVWHKGMGTREKRDTSFESSYNRDIYQKKWGKIG